MKEKKLKSAALKSKTPSDEGTTQKVPVIVRAPGQPKGIVIDKIEIILKGPKIKEHKPEAKINPKAAKKTVAKKKAVKTK
jgi:hypothetical protein